MKVLVVDDQQGIRQVLKILVHELGDTAGEACNGHEALEKVKSWLPDVVFMDIRMPGMGGVEALEKIKILYEEIPVIMMTAYGSDGVHDDMKKMGAAMCLTKPFDVNIIKEILDDLRAKKRYNSKENVV